MQGYKRELTVDVHDVDFNGVAKASALMRYMQSAAQGQLTENGLSYDDMRKMRRAFLLSKIRIEFTDTLRAYEPLVAVTFPCESRGYSFLRCYKLLRGGETVARAASVWALIDTETRELVKVNDFELGLDVYAPLDMPLTRIVMPKTVTEVGRYTVTYGAADQNRHMNNTVYPDMYANFLPLNNKRIESLTVSYLNEALLGEELTVLRGEQNGAYYFRTLRTDGKTNTEAEIKICDI